MATANKTLLKFYEIYPLPDSKVPAKFGDMMNYRGNTMSMLGNKIYCRWPNNIYDKKKQKEMGFHRCSKECFFLKSDALKVADRIGCGIFYCKLAKAWHLGKGTVNY